MIKFFTTATLILFLQASLYSNLNSIELKIIQEVDKSINESIQFLEETVKINSGTFNQNGIKQCGLLYKQKLAQLGFTTVWHSLPKSLNRADHLFAYSFNIQRRFGNFGSRRCYYHNRDGWVGGDDLRSYQGLLWQQR